MNCLGVVECDAWFAERGITVREVMTDNGSAYVSKLWVMTCQARGLVHIRTRPYRPRTNGKAERFIQTLLREWAYARPYESSAQREAALQPREAAKNPPLEELAMLDDTGFRERFSGSPIKRIGRDRFVRNCLYAAGNSGEPALMAPVQRLLADPDPAVAEAASWSLDRLAEAMPVP